MSVLAIKGKESPLTKYEPMATGSSEVYQQLTAQSVLVSSVANSVPQWSSRKCPIYQRTVLNATHHLHTAQSTTSGRSQLKKTEKNSSATASYSPAWLQEQYTWKLDHNRIKVELQRSHCDWIDFKMNVPAASHIGGVWERQIRTVRSVLFPLLASNGRQLDDESLPILMCEVESIVNSRPLTVNQLADPDSAAPLTPNYLLTMKSKLLLAPPLEPSSQPTYTHASAGDVYNTWLTNSGCVGGKSSSLPCKSARSGHDLAGT